MFNSTVSGGTSPYSYQWYLNGTTVPSAMSSSWAFTPSSSGSYKIYMNVTDNVGVRAKSNIAAVTVNPAPSVSIAPASAVLDVGLSQLFTSTDIGGTLPFSYQWYLNGVAVPGATNPTWTFTPASSGSYTVYLNVTDSTNTRVKSNVASVTVNPALLVSISPTSTTLDMGQSQMFTSSVSGGMSPFSYQWYLNGALITGATGATWVFTPSSFGSYTIYLNVTDGLRTQATSNNVPIFVNRALSVSISLTSATLDVGQSQTFTSTVQGGMSPIAYQWYLNGAPVPSATGTAWTFRPTSGGSYTVYANVTDSLGVQAKSNNASVTVNAALSVIISPTSGIMDVGQSKTLNSTVTGGTLPLSYQWYFNGVAVPGATSMSWTFSPGSSGSYNMYVNVTDPTQAWAVSVTLSITVNQQLTVTISPTSTTIYNGSSQTFTANAKNGTSPYTYQWYLGGSAVNGATSSSWTYTPSHATTYQIYLIVTDSVDQTAQSGNATLTVNTPSTTAFSVVSNSTVTGLAFNSTSEVLSFTVSGPSGTHGFTNVTIAKTLIVNTSTLEVYLDGNKINYTMASTNYYWLIHFTYHHSTHKIVIYMRGLQPEAASEAQYWSFALSSGIIIALIAAAIVIMGAIVRKKTEKKPNHR
jgi:hypothetical protein